MNNFTDKITALKNIHGYRETRIITKLDAAYIQIDNNKLINFCSNDYLSMSSHPELIEHYKHAIHTYGLSSSSSHLISGHTNVHHELEEYLAAYLQVEKVLLFSTGYMANLGIFSALRDDVDWILQDKLNHASLIDANFLIQKPILRYSHNNLTSLQTKLNKTTGNGLVATDNIFSMDGDIANILAIYKLIANKPATLVQDDAHGFGIYKSNIPDNSIYMATFGKAIGLHGACIAGNTDALEYIMQKSRPYIYTTALPPATAMSVKKSLELIESSKRVKKLKENIKLFKNYISTNSNTAIQPIIIGDNQQALQLEKHLFNKGFYIKAVRPPTVPKAILRVTLNAGHEAEQITSLCDVLSSVNIDNKN